MTSSRNRQSGGCSASGRTVAPAWASAVIWVKLVVAAAAMAPMIANRRVRVRSAAKEGPATIVLAGMNELVVRRVPLAETRPMRQAVLRPHQAVQDLAAHEPPGSV